MNTSPRLICRVGFVLGLALLFVLGGPAWAAGPTLTNKELGFTLHMPDGFVPFEMPNRQPSYLGSFELSSGSPGLGRVIVGVDRGHGLLGRAIPQKKDLPEDMRRLEGLCIDKGLWGKEQIVVIWWTIRSGGVATLIGQAHVPLAPCSIMVTVAGARRDKADLDGHLKAVLAGLSGKVGRSRATTSAPSADRWSFLAGQVAGAVAGGAVAFWVGWRLRRPRKASQPNAPGAGPAAPGPPPTPPTPPTP